jgi:hypothetical protein
VSTTPHPRSLQSQSSASFTRISYSRPIADSDSGDYRDRVVKELLHTEQSYVSKLGLIVDVFIVPLRDNKILSQRNLEQVFSNLEDVLKINQTLLASLQTRRTQWNETQKIGDILLNMCPIMKVAYAQYTEHHADALIALNEALEDSAAFAQFVEDAHKRSELEALPLQSYLILVRH